MIKKIINSVLAKKDKWVPLMDQGIVSGGNFFIGILLVRKLGLEAYGEFALIWLIVLFCSSIHQGWIISPMYTFGPQFKNEEKKKYFDCVFSHQLLFAIGSALLSWVFLYLSKWFFPEWEIASVGILVPLTVFSFLMYDYLRKTNYASEKASKAFLLDIVVYGTQILGLLITSIFFSLDLNYCLLIISISYSTSFIFSLKQFFNLSLNTTQFVFIMKKHWKFSKWLVGTSLLQWVSGNFFIIASASLLSPATVGAIRILQNIIGIMNVLFIAVENYIPIRAINIFKANGLSALGVFIRKIIWQGSIATLLIGGTMALFGKEIMGILYKGEHTDYAYLLYGFAVLYVFVFVGINFRFIFRTIEYTQPIFIAYIFGATFSLLFAKPIIQYYGIMGVVIGLISNQIIMQTYFIYSLRKKTALLWK